MNFNKFKEIAYALLDWNEHNLRAFHVSFLIRRNKILSIAVNKRKTHTINLRNKKFNRSGVDVSDAKFQCSEYCCIKQSKVQNIDYHKCKMVNVRITRENKLGLAAPCESCKSLLAFFNIKEIYFTNDSGEFEKYLTI